MEKEVQQRSHSCKTCQAHVLNISGKVESSQSVSCLENKILSVPDLPVISPKSFPIIMGRILLRSNCPPEPVTKVNLTDFEQNLCFLCMEKPSLGKRVYHMFVTNEMDIEKDYLKVRKTYEKNKDIVIVDQLTLYTLCARSLYHRVQNKLTDVKWNKHRNVFEMKKIGLKDNLNLWNKLYALENEERAKLFNYTKFLSATKS
ncbi:uncharacterized protein LOC27208046 [Drosophila simulans]|uniref:Uncharacterized protein n=1 Tax=Drosophila simulans TaxID=7240 RepID=A0A0J9RJI5_DROSI|nr:uncharacterized protein LOC27208046 [Drosophila simulans]KMY95609.1 uncharacterized protein Dsimw501_GD28197 [Drosophila simulans]